MSWLKKLPLKPPVPSFLGDLITRGHGAPDPDERQPGTFHYDLERDEFTGVRADGSPFITIPTDAAQRSISRTDLAQLATLRRVDGPLFVDGSRWLWQESGTPDGATTMPAADGGVWAREYSGPPSAQWFRQGSDTERLRAALSAKAGALDARDWWLTDPVSATTDQPITGAGRNRTVLRPPVWGRIKGGAVLSFLPGAVGVAYGTRGCDFEVNNSDAVPNLTGLSIAGSSGTYRDIGVTGFNIGVAYNKQDTFNNRLWGVVAQDCTVGFYFPAENINSGSLMLHVGCQAIGNMDYAIKVIGPGYYNSWVGCDFEQFKKALIYADSPLDETITDGWIETSMDVQPRPHLVRHEGPGPLVDMGIVRFTNCKIVWLMTDTSVFGDLVYAIQKGAMIFNNVTCIFKDAYGTTKTVLLNKILTHHNAFDKLPGALSDLDGQSFTGAAFTNDTPFTLNIRVGVRMQPYDMDAAVVLFRGPGAEYEAARAQVPKSSGTNASDTPKTAQVLTMRVLPGEQYKMAKAGALTTITYLDYWFT